MDNEQYITDGIGGDWSSFPIGSLVRYSLTDLIWYARTGADGDEVYVIDENTRYRSDGAGAWTLVGELTTASNVGGFAEVFKQEVADDLEFKTLQSSDGSISFTENTSDIDFVILPTISSRYNNLIIDGQLNHWDEGTSFTADGYDATLHGFSEGGGTATITREDFALGQTAVPSQPQYFKRHNQTANGTDVRDWARIKGVEKRSNGDVTISFYADSDSGTLVVTPSIVQNFGTGGSPSTSVETTGLALNVVDTGMALYTATITLPSVSGKTLGSNNNDYIEVRLNHADSTTFTFDYANIALVEGSEAYNQSFPTAGEERHGVDEYYQIIGDYVEGVEGSTGSFSALPRQAGFAATARAINMFFRRSMRAIPDITIGSLSNGTVLGVDATVTQVRVRTNAAASTSEQELTHIIADARF